MKINPNLITSEYNLITDGSPVKTGRKIDGKDEYVVRVGCGNMPNSTSKTVELPVNIQDILFTRQVQLFGQSNQNEYPIMQSGISWYIGYYDNTTKLNITTTSDRSRFTCYTEIYFIYK